MFGKTWREAKTGVVSDLLLAPVKSSVTGFCTVLKSEVKRLLQKFQIRRDKSMKIHLKFSLWHQHDWTEKSEEADMPSNLKQKNQTQKRSLRYSTRQNGCFRRQLFHTNSNKFRTTTNKNVFNLNLWLFGQINQQKQVLIHMHVFRDWDF